MSIVLIGSTSGSCTLQEQAVAGTTTLTLPTTSGTVALTSDIVVPTTLYAIGTYITGRPSNLTNYAVDSTIAGSSLYTAPPGAEFQTGSTFRIYSSLASGVVTLAGTLINTGTWRCVSNAFGNGSYSFVGLWVRIS
jgi:hypothetical protein